MRLACRLLDPRVLSGKAAAHRLQLVIPIWYPLVQSLDLDPGEGLFLEFLGAGLCWGLE